VITLIEARNYRCLRLVRQPLGPFQMLVGPNAAGKSALLDVVRFLGCLTTDGLHAAIAERTSNVFDLLWRRSGHEFEIAIEVSIPGQKRRLAPLDYDVFRYEVAIEMASDTSEAAIGAERGFLKNTSHPSTAALGANTDVGRHPEPVITRFTTHSDFEKECGRAKRLVLLKETRICGNESSGVLKTDDLFFREGGAELGQPLPFRFGARKSALANLPEDETLFPVATWFKQFLAKESIFYQLDAKQLQAASPPAQPRTLQPNAANLPWVVADFQEKQPAAFADWLAHLRIALPDLRWIDTVLREDDRHRYLVLEYGGGLRVPSWSVSEGTLRLIALTLPAYLQDWEGTLLVEEPENGLHPLAIEVAFQSLSSVGRTQVLLATHSPLLVGLAKPNEMLCFTKDDDGATQIMSGNRHPRLADWHGEVDLGTLFASGVFE
jgi:predicted ATPase